MLAAIRTDCNTSTGIADDFRARLGNRLLGAGADPPDLPAHLHPLLVRVYHLRVPLDVADRRDWRAAILALHRVGQVHTNQNPSTLPYTLDPQH